MIECYECKGKVSSKANACPHCGLPIEVEIVYHDNGQMGRLTFLKDGKEDGLYSSWYENGQKASEKFFKDGKEDGLWTDWYENGQKGGEGSSRDDRLMSAVRWKPNGEKCPVTNVKDGNGVDVCYYWPGAVFRTTYEYGEVVGSSEWLKLPLTGRS